MKTTTVEVMFNSKKAGILRKTEDGFLFSYDPQYMRTGIPISASLPFQEGLFESRELMPFFQGLLPEGWYRELVNRKLKLDREDSFGLLAAGCTDCAGAVWIRSDE